MGTITPVNQIPLASIDPDDYMDKVDFEFRHAGFKLRFADDQFMPEGPCPHKGGFDPIDMIKRATVAPKLTAPNGNTGVVPPWIGRGPHALSEN